MLEDRSPSAGYASNRSRSAWTCSASTGAEMFAGWDPSGTHEQQSPGLLSPRRFAGVLVVLCLAAAIRTLVR